MPPLSDEQKTLYRLSQVEGLGPVRLRRLLAEFEQPSRIIAARNRDLQAITGISLKIIERIQQLKREPPPDSSFTQMDELNIRLVFYDAPDYPELLKGIDNAPLVLSVQGDLLQPGEVGVAIVGSRRSSPYGEKMARLLATDLARRGYVVVSGLARGIDAVAHRAALAAGGRTIAVLASGLGNIYPPEHRGLAEEVAAQGAVVSEAPVDGAPIGALFPQRNRIISGISVATLVVEASARSGALSTVTHALEQGREVLAIPGRVGDSGSEGTNRLIQQGAGLVTGIDDVIAALDGNAIATNHLAVVGKKRAKATSGPPRNRLAKEAKNGSATSATNGNSSATKAAAKAPPAALTPVEEALWKGLAEGAVELEVLLDRSELSAAEASAALLMLEIKRLVRRLPGNRYERVEGIG